MSLLLVHFVGL